MLTVWPVSSLSRCRCGAEISRSSIELIAEKPRSSTRGPSRYFLRRGVLLEVAERGERRDVAVRRAAAEADLARELAHPEQRAGRTGRTRESRGPRSSDWEYPQACLATSHVLLVGTPS